jgi:hypothetical protein
MFFFRTRPTVLGLAASTILSSTTLSANKFNVQRARPRGADKQASAISFASFSPSKIRGMAGVAIVEFKRRNPRVGCPRIAQEIARTFGIDINKDIVRRVLAKHYRPEAGTDGPSWLSFIGHVKDSLWSVDLFRCEAILLRSQWVMVVTDVFTRRIIGFGVERADLCGVSVCLCSIRLSPEGHLRDT